MIIYKQALVFSEKNKNQVFSNIVTQFLINFALLYLLLHTYSLSKSPAVPCACSEWRRALPFNITKVKYDIWVGANAHDFESVCMERISQWFGYVNYLLWLKYLEFISRRQTEYLMRQREYHQCHLSIYCRDCMVKCTKRLRGHGKKTGGKKSKSERQERNMERA